MFVPPEDRNFGEWPPDRHLTEVDIILVGLGSMIGCCYWLMGAALVADNARLLALPHLVLGALFLVFVGERLISSLEKKVRK